MFVLLVNKKERSQQLIRLNRKIFAFQSNAESNSISELSVLRTIVILFRRVGNMRSNASLKKRKRTKRGRETEKEKRNGEREKSRRREKSKKKRNETEEKRKKIIVVCLVFLEQNIEI